MASHLHGAAVVMVVSMFSLSQSAGGYGIRDPSETFRRDSDAGLRLGYGGIDAQKTFLLGPDTGEKRGSSSDFLRATGPGSYCSPPKCDAGCKINFTANPCPVCICFDEVKAKPRPYRCSTAKCDDGCEVDFNAKPCPVCICSEFTVISFTTVASITDEPDTTSCSTPKCDAGCQINYDAKPCPSCTCSGVVTDAPHATPCSTPKCDAGCQIDYNAKPCPSCTCSGLVTGEHFGGKCKQLNGLKGIRCPPSSGESEGTCIHREFICDGDPDCPEGLDEKSCDGCPINKFRCSNGTCVDATKMCDSRNDCGDSSDEMCEGYFIPIRTTTTTTPAPKVNAACRDLPVPIGGSVTYMRPQGAAAVSRITQSVSSILAPDNPTVDVVKGFYAIGTHAVFKCVSRYYSLVGSKTRRCQGQGEWSGRAAVCNPECGQSDEGRLSFVVDGQTSTVGQWPWQVAISRRLDADHPLFDRLNCHQGWCMVCGGSLLSERWVVTAAHCVCYEGRNVAMAEDGFRVYLGKHYRDDRRDDELVQVREVREIHVHENYFPRTFDSDIALMQLDSPVQLNSRVQPVCLPTHMQLFEGKEGVVTGWGDLYGNKTYSPILQHAALPVVMHDRCRQAYQDAKLRISVTPNMFCAGLKEGQRDACQGDSGGPMVFYNNATYRWVLEGIVSWGGPNGCGVREQYGGFTAVYKFLEWIYLFF